MTHVITSADELRGVAQLVARAPIVGFDTETTGLEVGRQIVGWSCAYRLPGSSVEHGFYVPMRHELGGNIDDLDAAEAAIAEILASPGEKMLMHNAKFDLATCRWTSTPIWPNIELKRSLIDTMVVAWLVGADVGNGKGYNLKGLVSRYLNYEMQKFDSFEKKYKRQAARVPVEEMAPYAVDDVIQLLRLWDVLEPRLDAVPEQRKAYYELEAEIVEVVEHMESSGVPIDRSELAELEVSLTDDIDRVEGEMLAMLVDAGAVTRREEMGLGSPQWMSRMIVDRLQWWPVIGERGKKGDVSSAVKNLEAWASGAVPGTTKPGREFARLLVQQRKLTKLRGTYALPLQEFICDDGRIHASFGQTGTATGRFSSSGPNLMNIPIRSPEGKRIRRAFIAEPGHSLIVADFSQVELRIAAHYSQDPTLLEIYRTGGDVHQMTADSVGSSRAAAKGINFGLIYGMGYKKLAEQIGESHADAKRYRTRFFAKYRRIIPMQERMQEGLRRNGYVSSLIGRRRYLPDIHSSDPEKSSMALRQAVNTTIQGSAADLIKIAMRNMFRRAKAAGHIRARAFQIIIQVHDELVLHVRNDVLEWALGIVKDCMENSVKISVPLVAEPAAAARWSEAK